MSHLVSFWWISRTLYIPELAGFYKNIGRFTQRTPNIRNIILLTDIVSAYTETLRKY